MDEELTDALGHKFYDRDLLAQALTHRSAALHESVSYERLEFLGDRVLGFTIAELLLDAYPQENEGALAKRHADLVRRETLADVAREAGIGVFIVMSRGEADPAAEKMMRS